MKLLSNTLFIISLLTCHCVYGQVVIKPEIPFFATTDISNEGIICGYYAPRASYQLWYPETNAVEEIGGLAPGENVGGRGIFSSDGKFLSGSSEKTVALPQDWQKKVFDQSFSMTRIVNTSAGNWLISKISPEGNGGILINSDWNRRWSECYAKQFTEPTERIVSISAFGNKYLFVAGKTFLTKSTNSATAWKPMTPVPDKVSSYLLIDFSSESKGIVGALLNENKYAVYSTADGGTSWVKSTGLSGVPVDVSHIGNTYYMVTKEGKVWQSENNGEVWTEIAVVANEPRRIKFYDESTGVITAKGAVYLTDNKGKTWIPIEVSKGITGQITWNDVAWTNKEKMFLVGTKDVIYTSEDGGATWIWSNKELSDGKTELLSVETDENYIHVCGENSTLYKKNRIESLNLVQISRYDMENKAWSPLGFLGGTSNDVSGGGYCISGDGKTVVGNSFNGFNENQIYVKGEFRNYAHGVAWSEEKGLADLGGLWDDMFGNTRCYAINGDGSVAVGYQEINGGDWVGTVWRKNPAGGYFPNEYILIDPAKGTDASNLTGECSIISENGKWIGGFENYYNNSSWIWSKETGIINLNTTGMLRYVGNDGEIAFSSTHVWTKESGIMPIADYLTSIGIDQESLRASGIDINNFAIQAISRNGRYLAGRILQNGTYVTCRIDLKYSEEKDYPEESYLVNYTNDRNDFERLGYGMKGSCDVGMAIRITDEEVNSGHTIYQVKVYLPAPSCISDYRLVVMRPSAKNSKLPGEVVYTQAFEAIKGLNMIRLNEKVAMPQNGFVGILAKETHSEDVKGNDDLPFYYINMQTANAKASLYTETSADRWMCLSENKQFANTAFPIYVQLSDGTFSGKIDYDIATLNLDMPQRITSTDESVRVNLIMENKGTKTLHAFNVNIEIDGNLVYTHQYEQVLLNGDRLPLDLTFDATGLKGCLEAKIYFDKLNGSEEDRNSANDVIVQNILSGKIGEDFYPRNVLLELFTTEMCHNCPEQDKELVAMLEKETNWVLIGHHTGFGSDKFTIKASRDLLPFQNNAQTSPMLMPDRKIVPEFLAGEGYGIMAIPRNFTVDILHQLQAVPSTLSITPILTFDKQARLLTVKASIESKKNPFLKNPSVTVYVLEDKIFSKSQEGSSGSFIHHKVLRACLTGSLGDLINLGADNETIETEKYAYTIPAGNNIENMSVVVFVHSSGETTADYSVENSAEMKVPYENVGIKTETETSCFVRNDNGRISISGDYEQVNVYAADGALIAKLSGNGDDVCTLPAGCYLVRIVTRHAAWTEKVYIP